jgi:hypothetical protein
MHRKSLLAVAVCTAAFAGASVSGALAGVVKGSPGTPSSPTNPIPIPPSSGETHGVQLALPYMGRNPGRYSRSGQGN